MLRQDLVTRGTDPRSDFQAMDSSGSHSVTAMLGQLRSDAPREYQQAAARIWARYMDDLLSLAKRHLAPQVRQREDEHDVLQSMYKSFVARQRRGDYELTDRRDLWRLLVAITENKARNVAIRHGREGRDYRREVQEQGAAEGAVPSGGPGYAPTPAEAVVLVESLQRRLEMLDEPLRQIALWKLDGYSNEEIAAPAMLDCAVRTVERKLSLIRQKWKQEFPEESSA